MTCRVQAGGTERAADPAIVIRAKSVVVHPWLGESDAATAVIFDLLSPDDAERSFQWPRETPLCVTGVVASIETPRRCACGIFRLIRRNPVHEER